MGKAFLVKDLERRQNCLPQLADGVLWSRGKCREPGNLLAFSDVLLVFVVPERPVLVVGDTHGFRYLSSVAMIPIASAICNICRISYAFALPSLRFCRFKGRGYTSRTIVPFGCVMT